MTRYMLNQLRFLTGPMNNQRNLGLVTRKVTGMPPIAPMVIVEFIAVIGRNKN